MDDEDDRAASAEPDEFLHRRIVNAQERWIEEHFGVDAAADANYGWCSGADSVASKVYGHGTVTTVERDGVMQHQFVEWQPLDA